jgi:hypothetical protein
LADAAGINGPTLGQATIVKNFFKGLRMSDVPRQKYVKYFDVSVIFSKLWSFGPDAYLSRKRLRRKALLLVMIDAHARSSDLAGMFREMIFFSTPNLRMRYFRPKSWRPGGNGCQGNFFKPVDVHGTPTIANGLLDTPQTLAYYFSLTESAEYASVTLESESEPLRPAWYSLMRGPGADPRQPYLYHPISCDTIRNEVKRGMEEAGVDVSVFTAHANRGAASSKAAALAVHSDAEDELLSSVIRTATWSARQTFERSYQGEIEGLSPGGGDLHFDSIQHALRFKTHFVPPPRVLREEVELPRADNWVGAKVLTASGRSGTIVDFKPNNPSRGPFRVRFEGFTGADWEYDELLQGVSRRRVSEADVA